MFVLLCVWFSPLENQGTASSFSEGVFAVAARGFSAHREIMRVVIRSEGCAWVPRALPGTQQCLEISPQFGGKAALTLPADKHGLFSS